MEKTIKHYRETQKIKKGTEWAWIFIEETIRRAEIISESWDTIACSGV